MSARNSYNVAPIPGDNNGGSGGGGGEPVVVGGGIPIGAVIPYASGTPPPKWLLCNGAELDVDTYYELYRYIGFTFGINGGIANQSVSSYSTPTTSTINFSLTNYDNYFIVVGSIVKLSGFTAITGPNINGLIVTVTAAPAINARGTVSATFSTPLPATGDGGGGLLNRQTFKLPDLRLATPIGYQQGTINFGTSGGASTYQLTAQNLPQHRHGVFIPGGKSNQNNLADNLSGEPNVDLGFTTVSGETYPDTGPLTPVSNSAFSIRNPYVSMSYIIRAED